MLTIEAISKSYGSFELGPIDLEVDDDVLSILGPSGCGKTTLLSTIAGLVEPDTGTVVLNEADITDQLPENRGTVVVFQDGALFPHMTAHENVAYAASTPEKVEELAATLEIEDVLDQRADTLSGGERQRVALARSLAADPDALLLDEPLANLDAPIKRRLRDELRPLLSSLEIPVIYVTHDQREATVIGDQIAVINDGKIHQIDRPTEVFERPNTPFVASFTGSINLFRARVAGTDSSIALDWNGIEIVAPDTGHSIGDEVWFCIRPAYVSIADGGEDVDDAGSESNIIDGTITRRVFEGDDYLVDITPEQTDDVIRTKLSSGTYNQSAIADQDQISLSLPKDSIHVIGD